MFRLTTGTLLAPTLVALSLAALPAQADEVTDLLDSAREAYLELSRKMSVFDREVYHSHGYVWLYLRKLGSTAAQAPQE